MYIIQKYFIKEFAKAFAVICMCLAGLFSLMDLIDKVDSFLPHSPSVYMLARYTLLTLPGYLVYVIPMSALVSGLFVFGQATKSLETVAVLASGGRLKRLLVPFVLSGLIIGASSFILEEVVVPAAAREAKLTKDSIKGREEGSLFKEGTVWLRAEDGAIVRLGLLSPEERHARDISIFRMNDSGVSERIEADEGVYSDGWLLKGVTRYDITSGETSKLDELPYYGLTPPGTFEEDAATPEEMGIQELGRYIDRLSTAGFKNNKLLVDYYSRFSFPLLSIFMVVLGISLPAMRSMGGLAATAIGIFISLAYWLSYTMALSMGYANILPPLLAAWSIPVLFGGIASWLYFRIPE